MSRTDWLALLLAILTFLGAAWITDQVFEGLPHLEDEMAYVWQAQAIEGGKLLLPTPPCSRCFLQPFVVDYSGMRTGKYPPGWPTLLAVALRLGLQDRINPLLAGLAIWLVYRLGKKITDERTGILAAFLTATSPLFLMNSGALLSHPWTLVLSATVALAGSLAGLHFLWQAAVTGNPLTNPYTLWWPYDQIGFGPDVGLQEGGYQPIHAWYITSYNLWVAARDMLGWGTISWLMLPFGLLALRRNKSALLVGSVLPALVLAYAFYWIAAWVLGPRYYFEGLYGWTIFTAAGIRWLAGQPFAQTAFRWKRWGQKARFAAVTALTICLIAANLIYYTPQRLGALQGLYGVSATHLEPFRAVETKGMTPALIMVHPVDSWIEYGRLLSLSSPYLNTPFIFTVSRGPEKDAQVAALYPNRKIYHYYADTPWVFYEAPR